MKIELKTVSAKKSLLITLLGVPVILFLSLGLAILTSTQWLVYLLVPLLGLTIYLGQRLSKTATRIHLNEGEHLKINNQEIAYQNIIGYYVNDKGLTQTALCLKLNTNETVQITGPSVGKQGKEFQKAQDEIIRALKRKNSKLLDLEYQDVYVRQTNRLRPFLYVMIGVVIIMDLLAIYLLVTGKMELPWQIFFANFLLIGLVPYLKKGKITNTNKT